MQFSWEKGGLIFAPDGRYDWMHSHAQNPAVLLLDDRLRVYFNCRPRRSADGMMAARPSYVDLDRHDPSRVLYVHNRSILELGDAGTFDQFGVMTGTVLWSGKDVYAYYAGWTRCQGVPYNHEIGLAISSDGGSTFARYGRGPVIGRAPREPFIQNSPYTAIIGGVYHMWYSTGTRWLEHDGRMESIYVLTHATSHDGIQWQRESAPCVDFRVDNECQTNPCVIEYQGRYHMWFCYRCGTDFRNAQRGYRIGYAWSDDLVTWHRDDAAGELLPSEGDAWDSEMVCYPCVVAVDGRLFMFYSGNGFGETGFGYATRSEA